MMQNTDPTIHITLAVDTTTVVGGDTLKGVVSLHIEQSSSLSLSSSDKFKIKKNDFFQRHWTSLVLELDGNEHVCIVRKNNQGGDQGRRFNKYKGKHRFVHLTLPIVSSWEHEEEEEEEDDDEIESSKDTIIFQYPFEWQLPVYLPGSFRSTREDCQPRINDSYCNLDYTLTAHLQPKKEEEGVVPPENVAPRRSAIFSSPSPPTDFKKSSHPVFLQIFAKERPLKTINGRTVEESLQRLHLLGFPRFTVLGHIMLGFGCDRHIVQPNSFVTVDVFGRNLSRVNIQRLQVQWIEHIHWTVKGKEYNLKTFLADVTTDDKDGMGDEWLAQPKSILYDDASCCSLSSSSCSWGGVCSGDKADDCSTCGGMTTTEQWGKDQRELYVRSSMVRELYPSTMSYPQKQLRLLVPQNARYSYEGTMIKVRHELVVKVETSGGCLVPSPSTSCRTFVRPLLDDEHQGAGNYSTIWEEDMPPTATTRKGTTDDDKDANTSGPTVGERFEEHVLVSAIDGGSTLSSPTTILAPTIHWPLENTSSTSVLPVSKPIRGRNLDSIRLDDGVGEKHGRSAPKEAGSP